MKNIYKFTTQTKQYIMLYKNAMNFTQIYLTNEFPECFAQYQWYWEIIKYNICMKGLYEIFKISKYSDNVIIASFPTLL